MNKNIFSSRAINKQQKPFAVTVWRLIVTGLLVSAVVSLALPISKHAGAASQPAYSKVSLSVGGSPTAAKIGDLDGDGRNDIAVVDLQGSLQMFFGNGAGSFDRISLDGLLPSNSNALGLDIGDLNGDGRNDIAVAFSSQTGAVSVLFNQGDRAFGAPVNYNTCSFSKGVAIGDLDQDGDNDLADISQCNEAGILLNNGQGGFAFNNAYGNGYASRSIALADFDRDGNMDIAAVNSYYSLVFVLIGDGHGRFFSYSEIYGGDAPTGIDTADFNGDGRLDFAFISTTTHGVSILLNQG